MYRKTKSQLNGVVRHNTLRILFLFFSLFTMLIADKPIPKENIETNATLQQADQYNSLGILYYKKGDYDRVLEVFNKSLKIKLATIGENHPYTIGTKNNLAYAFRGLGSKYKKEKNYIKAIDYIVTTTEEIKGYV